jgi:hypothetical protein
MNLVKFIDNRFQELRVKEEEETKKQAYSITRDSEVLALQSILKWFRAGMQFAMISKVLGHYVAVLCGWAEKPRPVLLDKLKAQIEKEKAEKESALLTKLKTDQPAS